MKDFIQKEIERFRNEFIYPFGDGTRNAVWSIDMEKRVNTWLKQHNKRLITHIIEDIVGKIWIDIRELKMEELTSLTESNMSASIEAIKHHARNEYKLELRKQLKSLINEV